MFEDILWEITGYLAIAFAASLVFFSIFCEYAAIKSSSRLKRAACIVTGIASLSSGAVILTFIVNWLIRVDGTGMRGLFTAFNLNYSTFFKLGYVAVSVLLLAASVAMFIFGIRAAKKTGADEKPLKKLLICGTVVAAILALTSLALCTDYFLLIRKDGLVPKIQIGKPVVYFYPEEETEVSAVLGDPDAITVSYPEYDVEKTGSGWRFRACPDGTLVLDGREYPYMYYEFDSSKVNFSDRGFVVPGRASAAFLEEQLGAMGFTDKEQAEFITYWLPRMAVNEYNRVEFLTGGQVDALMPLNIVPEPDNVLRVYMLFAPCSSELALMLKPQELPVLTREGFTVLEWGGSDLGSR